MAKARKVGSRRLSKALPMDMMITTTVVMIWHQKVNLVGGLPQGLR
jgi:hypothetical protein